MEKIFGNMKKRGGHQSFLILFILLAGFFLRLLATINKDFWLDEAFSYAVSKQNLTNLLIATIADNNPPLYYLFLHFWLKINQSALFLRLPSIIFGLVSIYLVYLIAKNLINEKVAIFSSVLFALSPLQVYFSAETRTYSLWTFLTLASFYFFLKILESPKKIYFFLFTFSFLLSLYTHYFSIIFFLSLNLFLFSRPARRGEKKRTTPRNFEGRTSLIKRKRLKKQFFKLLYCQLLASIIFLSWFLNFLSQPHPKPWHITPLIGVPATFLSFTLGGVGAVSLKTYFLPNIPFLIKGVFILTSIFFILVFLLSLKGKEKSEEKILFFLLISLPILTTALASFFVPIYSPRPFLIVAPYFYILASIGIERLNKRWIKIITVFSLIFILFTQNFYPPFKPQTLKKATALIKKQSLSSPIIVHTDILTFYPFSFYFDNQASQFLVFPSQLTKKTTDIIGGSPIDFGRITEKKEPFWSVHFTWDEKTWKFKKEQSKLKKNFKYDLVKTINDLEIFYYQPL